MPKKNEEMLLIVDLSAPLDEGVGDRVISSRGIKDFFLKTSEHAVGYLKDNMTKFVKGVQNMMSDSVKPVGDFQVDTVEINAQLTSEGRIGFAGTGLNLQGEAGFKIIFKRSGQKKSLKL